MARNPVAKERQRLLREQLEREAWIGRQILHLVEGNSICTIRVGLDVLRADIVNVRGKSRSGEGQNLQDLLIAVSEVMPTKTCHGPCGRTLPITSFGHDRNKPDGRLLRCKKCEAERVRAYKGKKQDRR